MPTQAFIMSLSTMCDKISLCIASLVIQNSECASNGQIMAARWLEKIYVCTFS